MAATVRGISVDGRGGSITKGGEREYRATYKVYTDDRNDGPQQINKAFGIPSLGDVFTVGNDFDPQCVVVSKSINQTESPFEWLVDVTWSSNVNTSGDTKDKPQQYDSPLDEPADVSYGFQTRRIVIPGYFNDPAVPFTNAGDFEQGIVAPNGELFEPRPEVDIAEPILTIVKNQQTINAPELMALANCVNKIAFYGADPRQLKLNAPTAVRKWDATIGFYWTVTYAMAFRWETWDIQLLNQGTYYFDSAVTAATQFNTTQVRQIIPDKMGNPKIVPLSTDGTLNTTGVPTFTRLRVFREIDFGTLGII